MSTSSRIRPPFQPDDFFKVAYCTSPEVSPDGARAIVRTERFDRAEDRWLSDARVVDIDRPSSDGISISGNSHRWTRDGGSLYFITHVGGCSQLRIARPEEMDSSRLIAEFEGSVAELAIAPSGEVAAIAVSVELPARVIGSVGADTPPDRRPRVIDHWRFRSEEAAWLPAYDQRLLVVDIGTGSARRIVVPEGLSPEPTEDGEGFGLDWSPDGRSFVVSVAVGWDDVYRLPARNRDLFVVDAATSEWRRLTEDSLAASGPKVSPDGAAVAFLRQRGAPEDVVYLREICVVPFSGGPIRPLSAGYDVNITGHAWAADSSGLHVTYADRGRRHLGLLGTDGRMRHLADDIVGMTARDGGPLGVVRSTSHRPAAPHVWIDDGRSIALSDPNTWVDHRTLSDVSDMSFPSAHPDRRTIHGWVARPAGVADTSDLPVVVDLHGGPYNSSEERFNADREFFVGQGYVFAQVNYRGSHSYGLEFMQISDRRHYPGWFDDPHTPHEMGLDVVGVIDAIREQGLGDPDRVFLRGISAGALLTSWVVGRTDRFRAAVAQSWYTGEWGAPMYGWYQLRQYFDGPPWDPDSMPDYWRRSPVMLAGEVNTPLLLVQGELDYFTPLTDAEKYYYALRSRGCDVSLAVFPDEVHGIEGHPVGTRDSRRLEVGWFRRHDLRRAE